VETGPEEVADHPDERAEDLKRLVEEPLDHDSDADDVEDEEGA